MDRSDDSQPLGPATRFFREHPLPMLVYDPETLRVLAANPAAVAHYGYSAEAFTALTLAELRPADEVERMLRLRRGRTPPYVMPGTFRHLRRDGTEFDAVVSVLGARWRGRPARLVLVADVTADRRALDRLLRSEQKFRTLFDSAYDAVLLLRGETLVECNQRAVEMFGAARERLLGGTLAALSPELQEDGGDSAERLRAHLRAARSGEAQHFPWLHRRPDGSPFEAEVHVVRLELEGDTLLKVQVRDVTDQKRRLEELQELRQAVEQGSSIVVLTDAVGRVRYVNRRFTEVSGFPAEEVVGTAVAELASPGAPAPSMRDVAGVVRRDGVWRGEFLNRTRSGGVYWERAQISAVTDADGRVLQYLKVADDISEQKAMTAQLAYLTHHDALTDLPNRSAFHDRLEHAVHERAQDGRRAAVLVLDLEGYQLLSDSLGRDSADELLRVAARRLSAAAGHGASVARLARDEFGIVSGPMGQAVEATRVAERVLAALEDPVEVDGRTAVLRPRIGIAVYPDHATRPAELIKDASLALSRARARGGPSFAYFAPAMDVRARERVALEGELRAALADGALRVAYQPVVPLRGGGSVALEALVRWPHPQRGVLRPEAFVPLAEETGLIRALGRTVLERAARQMRRWREDGVPVDRVAVNLSPMQLRTPGLVEEVREVLRASSLEPARLELEVTETAAVLDHDRGAEVLANLRGLGVRVALDDFGTGYASLATLRELSFDAIKLDRSFVQRLGEHARAADEAILAAVVALGAGLEARVVAEGVETEAQLAAVRAAGVDAVQGFLIAEALPPEEVASAVARLTSVPGSR